jgi:hypothetical protein
MRRLFLAATAFGSGLAGLVLTSFAAVGFLGGLENLRRESNLLAVTADLTLASVCFWLFYITVRQWLIERGAA